ncbi:MAG: septum formation initiator family protein [Oscillospiraceae bacterium]|nr:septum formation initiator family protein [Clostridiales bacterium]MDY2961589.1 septum formation initiator family protein [Oscillospiraceae bacterium]MDD6077687.1 septum formation initiator family protein [Clostridiales bacterium]MDD6107626.1 septum formation initiator family protein [Clostridiales bacterium]MDD6937352.1 septum formation initiator family protein [Clostridiales bacterium]
MKFKKAGIITKIVIAALLVYAVVSLVTVRSKTAALNAQTQQLQQQVTDMTQSNAELEYKIEHSEDADTIEEIARDKLGLVKPGEKIFYDMSN